MDGPWRHWSEVKRKLLSRVWLFVSPWTIHSSPGQNTGVGSLFLLQGIFLTQESNQGLLHCRQILYQLSYQGSPLCKDKYCIIPLIYEIQNKHTNLETQRADLWLPEIAGGVWATWSSGQEILTSSFKISKSWYVTLHTVIIVNKTVFIVYLKEAKRVGT